MGVSPHLLYQDAHERCARLLGRWSPLFFGLGYCPPLSSLSLNAVCSGRTLLGGCHLLGLLILSWGAPFLPLGHTMRWVHTLTCGWVSSFLQDQPARQRRGRSVPCPPSACLLGLPSSCSGMPCSGIACCCTGGSPRHSVLSRMPCARAVRPPPHARARFARGSGAGGHRPPPGPMSPRGSQGGVLGISPPCPRCSPLARAAGWGVPRPIPPLLGRSR